ncbi:MAG: DUF192 domain-containing protein [Archaeoglobaceae archaeon]
MQAFKEDGTFICEVEKLEDFRRYLGLMFRRGLPDNRGLLLKLDSRSQYLHSFFVFFTFHAVFLDKEFRVEEEFIMKPFQVKRAKGEWVLETTPKDIRQGEKLLIR